MINRRNLFKVFAGGIGAGAAIVPNVEKITLRKGIENQMDSKLNHSNICTTNRISCLQNVSYVNLSISAVTIRTEKENKLISI